MLVSCFAGWAGALHAVHIRHAGQVRRAPVLPVPAARGHAHGVHHAEPGPAHARNGRLPAYPTEGESADTLLEGSGWVRWFYHSRDLKAPAACTCAAYPCVNKYQADSGGLIIACNLSGLEHWHVRWHGMCADSGGLSGDAGG